MPSFTNQAANMMAVGPLVEVLVGPSRLYAHMLHSRGKAVPTPVKATAMIDTGASGTVITPSVIEQLGLSPIGRTTMSTPSTTAPVEVSRFHVSLALPNNVVIPSVVAIEAPLGGQHIDCLIGRDVLRHGVLTYIGYINQFTLSF